MPHRILFVTIPNYIGGAEISLLTLMRNLQADRYKSYLLTSSDGLLLQQAREAGIATSIQEFPWFSRRRPWRYGLSINRLVRTIRKKGIDLVHTNCDHSLRYVMRASRLAGIPYVSHVRDLARTWFQPDKVVALNRATRVIANSNATARACVQAGVESDRVTTIYNPIDTGRFLAASPTARAQLRAEFGIPTEALVIGIVGQIQPIKGHQELIEAGFQLLARVPKTHFLIVGTTPPGESNGLFLESLRTQVLESGHPDHFHFVGFRSDIPAVMKAIDILAVPSWMEPFGRVAVEGMAAGCAVVGTNAGGLPEIITDTVDGLLVPPKDAAAFFTALYRLALDLELRHKLAQGGRCTAQRFTVSNHIEQVQTLYDTILSVH